MPGFDFICPMNYPYPCNLNQSDVDMLQKDEGKKIGFLMYQFKKQDKYLVETVTNYFNPRNCHIHEAAGAPGTGVKVCKICRYATVSHFGIASLTPQNFNVNLEIGLMWGQGKPILFLANPKRLPKGEKLENLSFDLSSHMVIEYTSNKMLKEKIEREAPTFLEKVKVMGLYQQALVKWVRAKLENLKSQGTDRIEFLRFLLLQGRDTLTHEFICRSVGQVVSMKEFNPNPNIYFPELQDVGILQIERIDGMVYYSFSTLILPILRQEAFKEIE